MAQHASVSVRVAAPASKVFTLVSDLSRMGDWSPECERVEWLDGAKGTAVGARFKGHNRRGQRRWSTNGKVVALEDGREVAFDITSVANLPVARWTYRVEAEGDDACTLTERWDDRRGSVMKVLGRLATGVKDRDEHNTKGMEETLQRIKAAAETL
ncbi:MAG: hypothetical protein QOI20_1190 [Acidimicrobiaceae bacterium]|nr:hypothetical protein [Acidimicrobiaceae bacterium]